MIDVCSSLFVVRCSKNRGFEYVFDLTFNLKPLSLNPEPVEFSEELTTKALRSLRFTKCF